jgi:hypothetical protein
MPTDEPQYTGHLHSNELDTFDLRVLDKVKSNLPYAESSNPAALREMAGQLHDLAKRFNAAAKRAE